MAEKMGEIGNVLSCIAEGVKTAKSMKQKSTELKWLIGATQKQVMELEKLQISDEPLLPELKGSVRNALKSMSQLENWLQTNSREMDSFDKFVITKIRGSVIPKEVMTEFGERLQKLHGMTKEFNKGFEAFTVYLRKAQDLAKELAERLQQKAQELQEMADKRRNVGTAGTVLGGAGLLALGFFTGGAAWVAAGALAGAAAVGAGASIADISVSDILEDANKMGTIARDLKSICYRADEIKLDVKAAESLETVLEFLRRYQENDAKIAEMEKKLRSLGH